MPGSEQARGRLLRGAIGAARVVRVIALPSLITTAFSTANAERYFGDLSPNAQFLFSAALFAPLLYLSAQAFRGHLVAAALLEVALLIGLFLTCAPATTHIQGRLATVLAATLCIGATAFLQRVGGLPIQESPMVPYVNPGPDWRCSSCRECVPASQEKCWSCRAPRAGSSTATPPS
jgi:hypothetical protein